MQTLGLRHAALQVHDAQRAKAFYVQVLKMQVEWEPDPHNVYLTSGGLDNLAVHESAELPEGPQRLDHIGFAVPTAEDLDAWFEHVQASGAKILRPVKAHRDGARSFYFADPDGTVVQMIHHPPISARAARKT